MEKDKGGRPRIELDWSEVDKLCALQCTGEEIAGYIGCSYDTLDRRCKEVERDTDDEGNPLFFSGFADYFSQNGQKGKISLRRKQFQAAIEGNPTMLVWLGKQWLGQKDRSELSGPNDTPLVAIETITICEPKMDEDGRAVDA